jgi:hypothetical protein
VTTALIALDHHNTMSSSPLPIPSSDDDVAMAIDDELPQTPTPHGGQSMSQAPPPDPLFLAGTPSTQAGGTPLRGVVARRAVGIHSTPRRSGQPLFARKYMHFSLRFWTVVLTTTHQPVHLALHTFLHRRLRKTRIGLRDVEEDRAGPVQIWTLSLSTFPRKFLASHCARLASRKFP